MQKLNKNKVSSKSEIDKQANTLINAIKKRQRELIIDLGKIVQNKTVKLKKQFMNLENDASSLSAYCL